MTLSGKQVAIVDGKGNPIPVAQREVTAVKTPKSAYDTLEAKVRVLDAANNELASVSHKTFFPQAWTEGQIQQAIYAAYAEGFLAGKGPFRLAGETLQKVIVEMVVRGRQRSATRIDLDDIQTAYPRPGQILDASHQP
jgi:hypothetical protein